MVHNGIEYGLMQAYAEGFDILRNAGSPDLPQENQYDFNVADIAEVWQRGSVLASWLLDLTARALLENPTLSNSTGFVQDSGLNDLPEETLSQSTVRQARPEPVEGLRANG